MVESRAVNTIGVGVYIEVNGVWNELMEVKSTPELGTTPSKLEATHLKNTSKVYKNGVSDPGSDLAVTCNAIPRGEPGSNLDLIDGLDPDEDYWVSFRFPKAKLAFDFKAQITGKIGAASVDSIQDFIVSFTPTSDPEMRPLTTKFNVSYQDNPPAEQTSAGTPVTDSLDYEVGTDATVKDCTWTVAGYDFRGWSTNAEGTGNIYKVGDKITMIDDITLYAQWLLQE